MGRIDTRKALFIIMAISFFFVFNSAALSPCTIVKLSKQGRTFVGNNEDGMDPMTYIRFLPASKGKYGRVYFTLSDKWPQGGMNDQGLFYDGTAAPLKDVVKSLGKPEYNGNLSEKMLEECASVPEAIALLSRYNLNFFRNGQMLIADRLGNSAIIEGDEIITAKDNYQIATNFYHSNPGLGGYPCHRYDIAETLVKKSPDISLDIMSAIMKAVRLKGYSYTQYSTVHDLKNRTFYYFRDARYGEAVKVDLLKELTKGERLYQTDDFFNSHQKVRLDRGELNVFEETIADTYPNGTLKCRLNFRAGELDGLGAGFYENGNKKWSVGFIDGEYSESLNYWSDSGIDLTAYQFSKNHAKLYEYYPSGEKMNEVSFKNLDDRIVLETIIFWNEDGSTSFSGRFLNGRLCLVDKNRPFSGVLSTYYKNKTIHIQRDYKDGVLDGKIVFYDASEKVIREDSYRNGRLERTVRYQDKHPDVSPLPNPSESTPWSESLKT